MGVVVVWCDDPQAGLGANGRVVGWFDGCVCGSSWIGVLIWRYSDAGI